MSRRKAVRVTGELVTLAAPLAGRPGAAGELADTLLKRAGELADAVDPWRPWRASRPGRSGELARLADELAVLAGDAGEAGELAIGHRLATLAGELASLAALAYRDGKGVDQPQSSGNRK